ncbi:MAG: GntR family transcriptional regulator [Acidobacteriaceae bacterium]
MKWFVNKEDKTPLYLQLKDLIKYHISTGTLQPEQKLPTVHGLAKELEVNFETVRKAYKELERQGLVTMARGFGTYVNAGVAVTIQPAFPVDGDRSSSSEATSLVVRGVRELIQAGLAPREIQDIIQRTIDSAQAANRPSILFVECNSLQANSISETLEKELGISVRPVLVNELNKEMAELSRSGIALDAVITTGFHVDEVRKLLGDKPIAIDYVIANMSPETRRKLDPYHANSKFGFVCRDQESKYYKDILQAELEIRSEILCCAIDERRQLNEMLGSVDVLLSSPSAYEAVIKMARPGLPVFNVQDRVDPLSLKMLKDRMAKAATPSLHISTNTH